MVEPLKLIRNPNVSWRTIEGQSVLIFNKEGEVQVLNEVGTYVWEHFEEKPEDLAAAISEEYDVSMEEALEDVHKFIEQMKAAGALCETEDETP